MNYKEYIDYLFSFQDLEYKEFNTRIVNSSYPLIGIRVPIMKRIAKELKNYYEIYLGYEEKYYEEIFIKSLLISNLKDCDRLIELLDDFTYKIDNWAICDSMCTNMKIVGKNKELFYKHILNFINSEHEFRIRVGVILLFDYYLCDEYIDEVLEKIKNINTDYYYVKMAIAWLICESFIKYRDKTLDFLLNNKLDNFILRKSISKIHDSYRVSDSDKKYLKETLL